MYKLVSTKNIEFLRLPSLLVIIHPHTLSYCHWNLIFVAKLKNTKFLMNFNPLSWEQYIYTYISQEASETVIRKADDFLPTLLQVIIVDDTKHEYVYSCRGSRGNLYKINLTINQHAIKYLACSCPFSQAGLCKHEVAALESLIHDVHKNQSIVPEENKKKDTPTDYLLLNNGIIDETALQNVDQNYFSAREYVYDVIIESIDRTNVVLQTEGGINAEVSLQYIQSTDKLYLTCTCQSKKSGLCAHKKKALVYLIKLYGINYFTSDFLERHIENYIEQYGLSLNDDYSKIFEFEITPQGIAIVEKIKNLFSSHAIEDFRNQIINEDQNVSVSIKEEKDNFGLGFVYIKQTKERHDFIVPVWAKYNNNLTELKSHFTELEFLHQVAGFRDLSEDNQLLVTKGCAMRAAFVNFNETGHKSDLIAYLSLQNRLLKTVDYKNVLQLKKKNDSLIKKNLNAIEVVSDAPINLSFVLNKKDGFLKFKAFVIINEEKVAITNSKLRVGFGFVNYNDKFYPVLDGTLMMDLLRFTTNAEINFFEKDIGLIYENIIKTLSENYEIQSPLIKKNKETSHSSEIERQVYIKDAHDGLIELIPVLQYPDNNLIRLTSPTLLYQMDGKYEITYQDRNTEIEEAFLESFCELHPDFESNEKRFYLPAEALMKDYWLLHTTEKLKRNNIKLLGANELKSFKFNIHKASISVALKSGIDWFEVALDISFGNQKVSLKDVQKAFLKRTNYVELSDGTIGILPEEWMRKFENYFKSGEVKKDALQISNYQFGIIDELYNQLETRPDFLVQLYETKQRLQNLENNLEFVKVPKGIHATLRPYQEYGFNWMLFLHKNQLGGCLADDMGLGKTLQTITFLQHLKTVEKSKTPSLIVAPTSLIFNWNQELAKFCPTLKALTYTGSDRSVLLADFKKYDIVITTYGTMMNDVETLQDFSFNYIILDESQAIKNPHSKRYKAVRLLKAFNRLVLTGTPIENNTFDLYAQFNFVNPGLLGSMSHFKTNFSDAIDKEKDEKSSELLSKIVHPFLLRRTKEKVALDLPEKIESIIYCEMPAEQRKVYDTFKNKYRDYILNKIDEDGIEKSQMYILEGLMKLRQICNATSILNEEEDYGDFSIKLDTLTQIVQEKTGHHKILIFSQFVKMLQLVKERLDEMGIRYEYLDGQTKNRQDNVNNFQENEEVRIFLISLKAGGTGLNLTEADYVFIMDPWWNPAVENQAIDRCYRIGQQKNVMAYRMICKDTIEEKIVDLQQKKKSIADSIIKVDVDKKSFNVNEVKDLFM